MFLVLILLRVLLVLALIYAFGETLSRLILGRSLTGMIRRWLAGGPTELELLVEQRQDELRQAARNQRLARRASELSEELDATLAELDDARRRLDDAEVRLAVTADLGDHEVDREIGREVDREIGLETEIERRGEPQRVH